MLFSQCFGFALLLLLSEWFKYSRWLSNYKKFPTDDLSVMKQINELLTPEAMNLLGNIRLINKCTGKLPVENVHSCQFPQLVVHPIVSGPCNKSKFR